MGDRHPPVHAVRPRPSDRMDPWRDPVVNQARRTSTLPGGWRWRDGGPGVHEERELAALAVAGSVGSGLADRFSDLELDCYWFSAPGEPDRTGPIHALGGELTAVWEYDPDEEEWSEDYRLGSST